jgi:ankyrin repeat protein
VDFTTLIVDIIRWLLDHGADPNVRTLGGSSWTPLHRQIRMGNFELVQTLLEHNADINLQCAKGRTPLRAAVSHTSIYTVGVDTVQLLLEHGADPNIPDHDQSTPLHRVSSIGWLEATQFLLSYGARVDENEKGRTPFQLASAEGR